MDKYGIISLSWIDREIEQMEKISKLSAISQKGIGRLRTLKEIKTACSNLPSAQHIFDQGRFIQRRGVGYGEEKLLSADDYITNYKP